MPAHYDNLASSFFPCSCYRRETCWQTVTTTTGGFNSNCHSMCVGKASRINSFTKNWLSIFSLKKWEQMIFSFGQWGERSVGWDCWSGDWGKEAGGFSCFLGTIRTVNNRQGAAVSRTVLPQKGTCRVCSHFSQQSFDNNLKILLVF